MSGGVFPVHELFLGARSILAGELVGIVREWCCSAEPTKSAGLSTIPHPPSPPPPLTGFPLSRHPRKNRLVLRRRPRASCHASIRNPGHPPLLVPGLAHPRSIQGRGDFQIRPVFKIPALLQGRCFLATQLE